MKNGRPAVGAAPGQISKGFLLKIHSKMACRPPGPPRARLGRISNGNLMETPPPPPGAALGQVREGLLLEICTKMAARPPGPLRGRFLKDFY